MTKPQRIELSPQEVDELLSRLENHSLTSQDYQTLKGLLNTVSFMDHVLREKKISISRLRNLLGIKTEKSSRVLKKSEDGQKDSQDDDENNAAGAGSHTRGRRNKRKKKAKRKKKKGHGRNGAKMFTSARKISIPHPSLKPGDSCPECLKGKLYDTKTPGLIVTMNGGAPIEGTVYELQKLRCSPCGALFSAPLPEDYKKEKYDYSAGSMIALLKYGCGFPFYRLQGLQENLGIPLAASTQWEIVRNIARVIRPVHQSLVDKAAQGEIIHNDDTTAKILSLAVGKEADEQSRKGVFTTGILSIVNEKKIALYFTGRNHAGENMEALLRCRATDKSPPLQMCDALSRNVPKEFKTILCNCLAHARRQFVEIIDHFTDECTFVIELLKDVYYHDAAAREKKMSPEKRLKYHQKNSGPLMSELKLWLDKQFNDKKVEPNSSLGKAIKYFQKHWEPLTRFLIVAGAPLDNNIVERALKKAIVHRKNAYFFKTENGALVADIFMSIIETCRLNGANPLEYLNTLQKHIDTVSQNISAWMPWNYNAAVASLA